MTEVSRGRVLGIGLIVFLLLLVVYLAWPTNFPGGDAIQAAVDIESDVTSARYYHPSGELAYDPQYLTSLQEQLQTINPRYFLDYPTSVLVFRLARALGYTGYVITPLIIFRAVIGALTGLTFFLAIYKLRRDLLIAFITSIGLGLTAAYWTFSTDIYQSINVSLIIALAFYMLIRVSHQENPGWAGKVVVALLLAVATLYNVLAVFCFLPFAVAVALLNRQQTLLQRAREVVVFGIVYGAAIVLFVTAFYQLVPGVQGKTSLFSWSVTEDESAGSSEVSEFEPAADLVRVVIGFGKSQVMFPGVKVRDFQGFRTYWDNADTLAKVLVVGFYGAIWVVFAIPVVFLLSRWRRIPPQERWLWAMLPIWFISYAGFNWYWLPSDVHYWMIPLMIWWTVVAMFLSALKTMQTRWYRPVLGASIAFIVFTFVLNFTGQFLPESRSNPWMNIAIDLADTPSNTLFVSDENTLSYYIAYFSHRDIVTLYNLTLRFGDDQQKAEQAIAQRVADHLTDGGTIYVFSEHPEKLDELAKAVGLTDASQLQPVREYPEITIYQASYSA